jgi:sugar phosphate isomerase/epimerase
MEICIFSKFFKEMDADTLGKTMAGLGVDGVDLAVREGGHIEAENVKEQLPKFQDILKKHKIKISMLTTSITDIKAPGSREIIETAGKLGIKYIKLGYWPYKGFGHYREQAKEIRKALADMEPVLLSNGVKAAIHVHAIFSIGINANHILRFIEDRDASALGIYFDIGHATIEGSGIGWEVDFDLASDRIFMAAIKNLAWYRMENGNGPRNGWIFQLVPLDSGLADIPAFAKLLKKIDFKGPVSFHSEYKELCSWVVMNDEELLEQTKKDLAFFHKCLND